MRVAHFDSIASDLEVLLAKSADLEPVDKAKVKAAIRMLEQLEIDYHGGDEDEEEAC